jgi:hypothetical protein
MDLYRKLGVGALPDAVCDWCHAWIMARAAPRRETAVCVQNGKLTHYPTIPRLARTRDPA